MIHLGVHNCLVVDRKCRESLDETRTLITKEVVCTPIAKTFAIPFNASKTFLARHMFDDCNNGTMELLKGEQLEHIQDKFYELNSPNIHNLVVSFKHHLGGGYIDNIFELKSNNRYDYIQECCFLELLKF